MCVRTETQTGALARPCFFTGLSFLQNRAESQRRRFGLRGNSMRRVQLKKQIGRHEQSEETQSQSHHHTGR
jgi:hypothetical protein